MVHDRVQSVQYGGQYGSVTKLRENPLTYTVILHWPRACRAWAFRVYKMLYIVWD